MDEGVVDTDRGGEPIEFGTIIANRYTILRPDPGSLATFTCRDSESDALRSIWAFKPRHQFDPNGEKFLLELTKVQSLEHPQLRKVLDFGREPNGFLYAVYEQLEARNLSDVLDQDWPLGDERVVWLVCQLLSALEVAHAVDLTHGDLRPQNILVRAARADAQNEEILLCGLGLASSARYPLPQRGVRRQLKLAEWMVGTPRYASPEQLRGEAYDARSDVYSAGVLLFQLLTRTQPFDAASDQDTAYLQCYTPPPPPSGYSRVSPQLETICLKALAKTPDVRYQTANEMRAALLASQVQRVSRLSNRPSQRPSRKSGPPPLPARTSATPEVVVATRISEPAARLARLESITAAPIETPVPAATPKAQTRRGPSAMTLLSVCAVAIAAAMILPDLRDRESEDETPPLSEVRDGFAKHVPADALLGPRSAEPQRMAAAENPPPSATRPAMPPTEKPSTAPAPQSVEASPAAPLSAPAPTAAAVAAAAPAPVRRAARVRVHAVDKTVVAAEASEAESAVPATTTIDVAAADAAPEPAPAAPPAPPAAPEPAALPAAAAAATAAPIVLPSEREVPHEPMPPPVTAPPPPRPIVLTNAPRAAASEPTSTIAQEIEVLIGEASAAHGAVSKAALRGAFNQTAFVRCYRESLKSGESSGRAMSAQLTIETNVSGRIVDAKVEGQGLPSGLVHCIETAGRLGRVREADTGQVRATVGLRFQVR